MNYRPQSIEAPDGTPLVVITKAEYERLLAVADLDEDARDMIRADRALAESDIRYPAEVVDSLIEGKSPVAAWRRYRGMTQVELAARSGVTQAAISGMERGSGGDIGSVKTRRAVARALGVTLDAIEPLD